MYNSTRRVKQFRRHQLSGTSKTRFDVPDRDDSQPSTRSNLHVRHRRAIQPDALRGAMLVALIVVTIILYILLCELERSSFMSESVPKPNFKLNQSTMAASQSGSEWDTTSTSNLSATSQNEPVSDPNKLKAFDNQTTATMLTGPGRTTRIGNARLYPFARLPEEHDTDAPMEAVDDQTHENEETLSPFDFAYCNNTCRFLLPVRIGEQESKARIHFTQLLMLARRLNRTIVLPSVGNSRMSVCSRWPFGVYYDMAAFLTRGRSLDSWFAVDPEEFAKWVDERPLPPRSFVVSLKSMPQDHRGMLGTGPNPGDVPFVVEKSELDPNVLSCLESRFARIRSSLPDTALSVSFAPGSLRNSSGTATHLVQLLSDGLDMGADSDFDLITGSGYERTLQYLNSSHLSVADIDILILDYDLRHPLFPPSPQPDFNLHYAPTLYDIADRLADNLGPFLGVHWRMENVAVQNLAWCAASLVTTLREFLEDDDTGQNLNHVWLATDHPRPLGTFMGVVRSTASKDPISNGNGSMHGNDLQDHGPHRKSSTFRALSSEHDNAIRTLVDAFQPGGDLDGWKLTDLSEQLRRYPYVEGRFEVNEELLDDSGVFGILDKLVIVQARVFFSGSTECGKTSSFSKQVIEARQETFEVERGKGGIRNVVEYFGTW